MANFNQPVTSDPYADVLLYIRNMFSDLAKQLEAASTSPTNVPAGSIRWNAASAKWQIYSGSPPSWGDLASSYGITITGLTTSDTPSFAGVRLTATSDASLSSTGHALQVGPTAGANLIADQNEVMARNNGATASLALNADGGNVSAGADILATGRFINTDGANTFNRAGSTPVTINRDTNDGILINFQRDGGAVATVTVSSGVVSYGAFCGHHPSQADGFEADAILVGTLVESVADLCEWKPKPRIRYRWEEKFIPEPTEEEPDRVIRSREIVEYQDGWTDETNRHLPKFKVSDTPKSRGVYGVFQGLDEDGDAIIAALGAFMVRVAPGETPLIGDYLESAGNGCARVQPDDILRASTVAKVTSTAVADTYPDGSFLLPCTLHCG